MFSKVKQLVLNRKSLWVYLTQVQETGNVFLLLFFFCLNFLFQIPVFPMIFPVLESITIRDSSFFFFLTLERYLPMDTILSQDQATSAINLQYHPFPTQKFVPGVRSGAGPSKHTYPLAAFLLLRLPELMLQGAVQLIEEPHFLAVLQESRWGRGLIWKQRPSDHSWDLFLKSQWDACAKFTTPLPLP